jgi:Cu(I)/Ag(I) efflux system periplasmic protein CusF
MKAISALILALALAWGWHAASAQSPMVDGVVVKVDVPAKKITIKHGPIPQLDMDEGMTMVYAVPDPAMLTAVKAGDKIKFEADQVNGQYTLTKIEKMK